MTEVVRLIFEAFAIYKEKLPTSLRMRNVLILI